VNGLVEVAGPEQFRLDDLVRQGLCVHRDPREVVADPHARYYGAELHVRALIPGDGALLGETHYADWLSHAAIQQ
jgi:hypothetical protein